MSLNLQSNGLRTSTHLKSDYISCTIIVSCTLLLTFKGRFYVVFVLAAHQAHWAWYTSHHNCLKVWGEFKSAETSIPLRWQQRWWLMTLYSSCACMVTVLQEVCGSRRGTVHTVEDFHVLVDMCGRTLWSRGHVGPWTLWNTGMTLCFHLHAMQM